MVLGLAVQGPFIWFGLSRLGRSITHEIRTVSLATLRLRHEAERLARRAKVALRADGEVLAVPLDRVAQQYARGTAGIGTDQLWTMRGQYGAATLADGELY